MVGQGRHVACGGPDARLKQLVLFTLVGGVGEEGEQPAQRMGGLAQLRCYLAFAADRPQDDVEAALEAVISAGGSSVGGIATTEVGGVGLLQVIYARDPEGNIVELQKWR